ncbi:hypothetical protein OJF2_00690 [Aquisphaera giovannonii]|uniref:Uncharacterized protein n=1 Tax=Aquisphaera giovannonii TaxID=406548 RepID=A0A5B9VTZ7_9BACT|nr:hypothetical protein OJF2_00690 [Aquisphaera giovannonii]
MFVWALRPRNGPTANGPLKANGWFQREKAVGSCVGAATRSIIESKPPGGHFRKMASTASSSAAASGSAADEPSDAVTRSPAAGPAGAAEAGSSACGKKAAELVASASSSPALRSELGAPWTTRPEPGSTVEWQAAQVIPIRRRPNE